MQFIKDFILAFIVLAIAFILPLRLFIYLGYKESVSLVLAMVVYSIIQVILMNGED